MEDLILRVMAVLVIVVGILFINAYSDDGWRRQASYAELRKNKQDDPGDPRHREA